jgi:D-lactate dehydrogenase (cytochrome)
MATKLSLRYLLRAIGQTRRCLSSSADLAALLTDKLPHIHVSTNPYDLEAHGRGESYHATAAPSAVVSPASTEEVVQLVKLCSEHQIPVIPFGAGTSVEGHVCAIHGGISLDMRKFDSIEVHEIQDGLPDPIAKVGAGVRRNRLNEELRHSGMQFVVDPGADATIGGMTACGASGTTAVKYGSMRENILGLECILPDGTFVKCGTNALKNSAGYDLTSLMTGSEGTLGVITSISVKLHPIPEHVVSAVCVFDDLFKAAEAVAALKLSNIPVARCEILDEVSVSAFNRYNKSRGNDSTAQMDEKPTLFLEFHGHGEKSVGEQVDFTKSICVEDCGAFNFRFTSGEEERKSLWAARHQLYYASIWFREGATGAIVTDACVPLSKFAELMTQTAKDVKELDVVGPCFGHAGDGNFHCILPIRDDDSDEYLSRLHEVNDNLIRRTLEAGGTCTGEHGIGYGKTKYLSRQYGDGAVHMMKLIKNSLDPKNIMNPGKVVPI